MGEQPGHVQVDLTRLPVFAREEIGERENRVFVGRAIVDRAQRIAEETGSLAPVLEGS